MTPLPTPRALTRMLRETHEAYTDPDGGGEYVCLVWIDYTEGGGEGWRIVPLSDPDLDLAPHAGREYVPGDECPCMKVCDCLTHPADTKRASGYHCTFDAPAAARRLLAAARDAGFR